MENIKKLVYAILVMVFSGTALISADFLSEGDVIANKAFLPRLDLVKGSGPEVFVLENGTRYWIPDIETFNSFNFKWENIKIFSNSELESYPQSEDWKKSKKYPNGSLLKGSGPEVYLIESEKKRWIPSIEVFQGSNFGWKYIINVEDKVLKKFKNGDNLTLAEPNKYPETFILSGPEQGRTLDVSEVAFKYSGTNPLGPTNELDFETFLAGYDTKWHNQGSKYEKKYDLLKDKDKNKVYTFYVRAKNEEGYIDASPCSWKFSVGMSSDYGDIEIRKVDVKNEDYKEDYIILRNKSKNSVNITGWTIETDKNDFKIPQAIEKIYTSFSKKEYSDIILNYKDEAVISMGQPFKGINFQVNKCSGYFNSSFEFEPSLDNDCPKLDKSDYKHLKKDCREFIDDLNKCEMPDYSNNWNVSSDSQCIEFINNNFSYNKCYSNYHYDPDFFQGEWRVFMNKSQDVFDNYSDKIILKNRSGYIIDNYEY